MHFTLVVNVQLLEFTLLENQRCSSCKSLMLFIFLLWTDDFKLIKHG